MSRIKVVSFDLEGTLVTPDFSQAVWYEGVPSLYAKRYGIDFQMAKAIVCKAYEEVGDKRKEWYDIKYWFSRFQLGDYREVLENQRHKLSYYPDASPVLSSLVGKYTLIVATGTAREFLPYLLDGLERYFVRIFSSISDYGQLKSLPFYTKVCQEIGVRPSEMVHIGDSWHFDFLAAQESGIRVFLLNRSQETKNATSLKSLKELEMRLPPR